MAKIKVACFFLGHGVYRAHRAVIFAIAQLSCYGKRSTTVVKIYVCNYVITRPRPTTARASGSTQLSTSVCDINVLIVLYCSVREYVFFVFLISDFKKAWLFMFFEMTLEKTKKVGSKNFVLNDANIVAKKKKVCWMSIEILASKLPDVMGTYRRLSHTVLSCILS